ncbi:MAG: 3-oxoadipyl-CoA thiolase [Pseudomonadota bacterium]|nr:3-oxoadipyl-CoA thiolase [Pseudomonadota bacterium]MEC8539855.1 3-oxoadipyl-CoA thiolase [Pseudomonadota bacterium]
MQDAYICDAVRSPIGRFGGALSTVRADDLAAHPLKALMARLPDLDWTAVDEVVYGAANQAGEDNRNIARMALLLAGLPQTVPGITLNRLCASGMEAVIAASRMIRSGEGEFVIAGGSESMSRAPFVMPKADTPFSRKAEIYDTTIGWRFVNRQMKTMYGTDSMPETGENVAERWQVSREDQDRFALRSQQKTGAAMESGRFAAEIEPVTIPQRKGDPVVVDADEHPRPQTTLEQLAKLPTPFRENGTVTAGNASGVNDGAAAMILASEGAMKLHGLVARARVVAAASAGVEPAVMGIGPVPATQKALAKAGLSLGDMDLIEINEAFAAQGLASMRDLGMADDDPRVNRNGGAIALGHPLGMSGARLVMTATEELRRTDGARYALCTMCVGVGQGSAVILEKC